VLKDVDTWTPSAFDRWLYATLFDQCSAAGTPDFSLSYHVRPTFPDVNGRTRQSSMASSGGGLGSVARARIRALGARS
jgi:hypothetical protein